LAATAANVFPARCHYWQRALPVLAAVGKNRRELFSRPVNIGIPPDEVYLCTQQSHTTCFPYHFPANFEHTLNALLTEGYIEKSWRRPHYGVCEIK
jgi:hypothetical protein